MAGPIPSPVRLAHRPTPLEPMTRLGARLGFRPGRLWVKRDDVTALGGGGNKARKLEYLCAEALALGCDILVTGGGPQSNHVRMTAAAASRLGLACVAVVAGDPAAAHGGNLVLDRLLGAELEWTDDFDCYPLEAAIEEAARRQADRGRRPYCIPIGGASVVGAACLRRRRRRAASGPARPRPGRGGGRVGRHPRRSGRRAGRPRAGHGRRRGRPPRPRRLVPARAAEVARATGRPEPAGTPVVDHDHAGPASTPDRPPGPASTPDRPPGPAYGAPTEAAREAAVLAARLEGLLLDPVYTAKAMAALVAARLEGRVEPDATVVFLHTGGLPALFAPACADWAGGR